MKGDRIFVFIDRSLNQGGTTERESLRPWARAKAFYFSQDAENGAQLRSRLASVLNVPQEATPPALVSPAALLIRHFEHPLCRASCRREA